MRSSCVLGIVVAWIAVEWLTGGSPCRAMPVAMNLQIEGANPDDVIIVSLPAQDYVRFADLEGRLHIEVEGEKGEIGHVSTEGQPESQSFVLQEGKTLLRLKRREAPARTIPELIVKSPRSEKVPETGGGPIMTQPKASDKSTAGKNTTDYFEKELFSALLKADCQAISSLAQEFRSRLGSHKPDKPSNNSSKAIALALIFSGVRCRLDPDGLASMAEHLASILDWCKTSDARALATAFLALDRPAEGIALAKLAKPGCTPEQGAVEWRFLLAIQADDFTEASTALHFAEGKLAEFLGSWLSLRAGEIHPGSRLDTEHPCQELEDVLCRQVLGQILAHRGTQPEQLRGAVQLLKSVAEGSSGSCAESRKCWGLYIEIAAVLLLKLEDFLEAYEILSTLGSYLERANVADTDDVIANQWRLWFAEASLAKSPRDAEKALELYEKAHSLTPRGPDRIALLHNVLVLRAELGRLSGSQESIEELSASAVGSSALDKYFQFTACRLKGMLQAAVAKALKDPAEEFRSCIKDADRAAEDLTSAMGGLSVKLVSIKWCLLSKLEPEEEECRG